MTAIKGPRGEPDVEDRDAAPSEVERAAVAARLAATERVEALDCTWRTGCRGPRVWMERRPPWARRWAARKQCSAHTAYRMVVYGAVCDPISDPLARAAPWRPGISRARDDRQPVGAVRELARACAHWRGRPCRACGATGTACVLGELGPAVGGGWGALTECVGPGGCGALSHVWQPYVSRGLVLLFPADRS